MNHIFIGIKGYAVCLDKHSGHEIWRTKLKSMATITTITHDEKRVFAYANGHLFCLEASSGKIKWENNLPGLGHSYCVISSSNNHQQTVVSASNIDSTNASSAN